jgi:hypothetical protein
MNFPFASMMTAKPNDLVASPAWPERQATRHSWKVIALALAVAGVSDVLAFAVALVLPAQLAIDIATALILFLILGRRWAILPGLIAEAIPGMGIFPVWVLVVLSIVLYDDIKKRGK